MKHTSSKTALWFAEWMPDIYFAVISLISIVVVCSAIKLFIKMQTKSQDVKFKIIPWQKWLILGLSLLLIGMFIGDAIYRLIDYYGVIPYHTSYAWKYNIFTSFFMIIMLTLWIFKGLINGQWIEWRTQLFNYKLTIWFFKKINKETFLNKYSTQLKETKQKESTKVLSKPLNILAPTSGKIKKIEEVNDKVFSEKIMGDGLAIVPTDGKIVSPVAGVVESAFHSGHAFGIRTKDNVSILVHIGIDTINLKGKGFKIKVKQGQKINAGEALSIVDLDLLIRNKYQTDVIVVILPESSKKTITNKKSGNVLKNKVLYKVK